MDKNLIYSHKSITIYKNDKILLWKHGKEEFERQRIKLFTQIYMANCNCIMDKDAAIKNKEMLHEIIQRYKDEQGPLIPILHEAQELYGYLPFEVQLQISEELGVPLAEIYGVVSFYSGFSDSPKGKFRINVCLGTACYVKGAETILDKFKASLGLNVGDCTEDGRFSLDACRCIGSCGLAPAVMVNDDVFGNVSPDDVELIISKYEGQEANVND